MHLDLVVYCSITFSMFSREISVDGRGIRLNIFKWNFFHVLVVYHLKNEFPSTQYFVCRLLKQNFSLMPYLSGFFGINVLKGQREFRSIKCSSTVNEISPTFSLRHGCECLENNTHVLLWFIFGSVYHQNSNISG